METRFRSLRIIGTILKVIAWIALVGGIVAGVALTLLALVGRADGGALRFAPGTIFGGLFGGVMIAGMALLHFLVLYATGDAIFLALAIEENTREAAHYLKGGDAYGRRL